MRLSRRAVLGGGVLLGAGYLVAHAVGHRPVADRPSAFLGAGGLTTLHAVLEVLLPRPEHAAAVAADVDAALAAGDPVLGEGLRLALTVLEHGGGVGVLSFSRFSRQDPEARLAVLEAWHRSSLATKRQIAAAMRSVALFAWYTNPLSWDDIGYDGPWVRR